MPSPPADVVYDRLAKTGEFISAHWTFEPYTWAWEVVADAPWLSIESLVGNTVHPNTGPFGATTGDGVYYGLAANSTGLLRTGHLFFTVYSPHGTYYPVYTIQQTGDPVYSFVPPSVTISDAVQITGTELFIDTTQTNGAAGWFLYAPTPWVFLTFDRFSNRQFTTPIPFTPGAFHSPVPEGCSVTANTGTTTRVGQIEVHDASFSRDWINGTIPPTTPPLAIFYINQLPPVIGAPPITTPPDNGAPPGATLYKNPFNLPDKRGYYYRCAVGNDGNIYSWRANNNAPWGGFDVGPTVASNTASYDDCRMAFLTETRRLYLVFSRQRLDDLPNNDVYVSWSDDEAQTWAGAKKILPGAWKPTIAAGLDGTLVIAGYVGPPGGPGKIQAVVMGPGDTDWSAPYTVKNASGSDLSVEEDTFHLIMPHFGERTWLYAINLRGDGAVSVLRSADPDASSTTFVGHVLAGGTHPTIGVGLDGTLVVATYSGPVGGPGVIKAVAQGRGDIAFGAAYTLQDANGTNIPVQDSTMHLCMPPKGDRHWVWVLMRDKATEPSERMSADPDASSII